MQEIQRDPLVAEVYLGKGGRRMLKRRALNRATGRVRPPRRIHGCRPGEGRMSGRAQRRRQNHAHADPDRATENPTGTDDSWRAGGYRLGFRKEREAASDMFRKGARFSPAYRDGKSLLGLEPIVPRRKAFPEDVLALFPVLPQMYHRQGGDLSGGQRQASLCEGARLQTQGSLCSTSRLRESSLPSWRKFKT